MLKQSLLVATAASLLACSETSLDPATEESLALSLQQESAQEMERRGTGPRHWIARLIRAVSQNGDSAALDQLDQARDLREQARAAHEQGDDETARALMEQSKDLLFAAIVATFPEAPERTGTVVDEMVLRIEDRLGDRDAPRIEQVLADVVQLRTEADALLAAGDLAGALDRNFQATRMLQRMFHFLHERRGDAPRELGEHVREIPF